MRKPGYRVLLAALVLSALAHVLLLGSTGAIWPMTGAEIDFPLEARLRAPLPSPPEVPPARRPEPPSPVKAVPPPLPEAAIEEPAETSTPQTVPLETAPAQEESLWPASPEPNVSVPVEPPATPEPSASPQRLAQRTLPPHLEIRYAVQVGEGGFTAGRATYTWRSQAGRYSLVSVAEATGLASLFVNARVIQTSEGSVDGNGLHPEQFWIQRGERRQEFARFNWGQGRLVHGGDRGGAALTPLAQDLLSFSFHLAMTAQEQESEFQLGITNGRRFKEYPFRGMGREYVEVAGKKLVTLHLQGGLAKDGLLDVWLDVNRSGIPVRVRTLDPKGKTVVLLAEEVHEATE